MTQPRLLGGRYELDGIVGRGGMGEVFRARDIRLDRIVAVKTLREDLARDATFQARFRREAQSTASLNHPSTVAVYDTGEGGSDASRVPYIVMEYVDGRTLRDLLRDDRRLLPERALEITDGVLRALDYSHRNGIVHRDIKPGNVMLTRTGEVKVMDFGIARLISDIDAKDFGSARAVSDPHATMTMTMTMAMAMRAQVIGTPQYLSPEQARGERVDARSDLYSTGCLLYELLIGRPPFLGDSPVAIAYQHVRENPVPPSQLDPEIQTWADSIVLRAMAKDTAQRYQSAAEMRTDIQRALSGVPVAAPRTMSYAITQRMGGGATPAVGPTRAIPGYDYGPEVEVPLRNRRRLWRRNRKSAADEQYWAEISSDKPLASNARDPNLTSEPKPAASQSAAAETKPSEVTVGRHRLGKRSEPTSDQSVPTVPPRRQRDKGDYDDWSNEWEKFF
jgi:serine/threonine protein kinase